MKPLLIERLRDVSDSFRQRSVAREFLQARILLSLQDHGAFTNWAFVGGTALRFLFSLPRYSEDLDFSLTHPGEDARFVALMRSLRADLESEAYDVDLKVQADKTVASAFVRFRGLLHEVGISPLRDETIAIKIEIDTRPPLGAITTTKSLRRHFMLNILHHDRASLFAGKLHALLARKYTKGRDLYDLAWYLSDPGWPEPNKKLLASALTQTGCPDAQAIARQWRKHLAERLETLNWKAALADVSPFLERSEDAAWVSLERLLPLVTAK